MYMNVQSLPAHIDALRSALLVSDEPTPSIIALVETQIPSSSTINFSINGYDCIHIPSEPSINQSQALRGTPGGGVSIYWRHGIMMSHIQSLSLNRLGSRAQDADYGRTSCSHWFDLQLTSNAPSVLLNITYISPQSNQYIQAMRSFTANMQQVVSHFSNKPIISLGDFNARSPTWDMLAPNPPLQPATLLESQLINTLGLTLLNTNHSNTIFRPTRPASSSVLDLAFINDAALLLLSSFDIGQDVYADHLPLHINLSISSAPPNQAGPPTWKVFDNPEGWQDNLPGLSDLAITENVSLQSQLLMMETQPQINQPTDHQSIIQDTWSAFLHSLNCAMSQCIKRTSRSHTEYTWFHGDVKSQHQRLCKARLRWRHHRFTSNAHIHLAAYRQEQQQFKAMAIKARATSIQLLYQSIMPESTSPLLWSAIARIRTSKSISPSASIPNHDGTPPKSPKDGLNNLCKQFIQFTLPERSLNQSTKQDLDQYMNHRFANPLIHCSDGWTWIGADIKQQCMWQRNDRSAAGPDGIPPIILKHLGSICYHALAVIFSYSWRHSVLPQQWTEANVFSLLKDPSKPVSDPNNYRPISVTSIFIRTLEHLIHRKLTALVDSSNLPAPLLHIHQYGFRKNRSCMNALQLVISSVNEEQRRRHTSSHALPTPSVFIDLKKAFDRVWHQFLMRTLELDFGITGTAWRWIWRWLHCHRRIRCVANTTLSDWHMMNDHGVPQGAVLSPLLFIMFINRIIVQISTKCPLINIPMFADDIALLVKSAAEFDLWWKIHSADKSNIIRLYENVVNQQSSHQSVPKSHLYRDLAYAMQMQRALTLFSAWLTDVGMQANSAKSKIVVFSSASLKNHSWLSQQSINQRSHWYHHLELDGFTLQLTKQYEYLGLLLDCNMSWTAHIRAVTKKVAMASSTVCRLFTYSKHCPHPTAALKLVKSLVIPCATYGIHFWLLNPPSTSKHADVIDTLHSHILKPLRIASNLPPTTHRLGLMTDFGLSTLHDFANQSLLRYYYKYSSVDVHQLPAVQQLAQPHVLFSQRQADHLHPAISRTLQDAHYQSIMNSKPLIQHKKWTCLGARARYSTLPALYNTITSARITPGLQSLPLLQFIPSASTLFPSQQQLQSQLNTHQPINLCLLPSIIQLRTYLNWRNQGSSINPSHQRATNSPITSIKLQPGICPALLYIEQPLAFRTLMRLRHGRAFTHDTRMRFPSSSINQLAAIQQPIIQLDDLCKSGSCTANSISDSVQHLLIDCPSHHASRCKLLNHWSNHNFGRGKLPNIQSLTLALLLGESPIPHIKPINKSIKQEFISWYKSLADFIIEVYRNLPIDATYPKPL